VCTKDSFSVVFFFKSRLAFYQLTFLQDFRNARNYVMDISNIEEYNQFSFIVAFPEYPPPQTTSRAPLFDEFTSKRYFPQFKKSKLGNHCLEGERPSFSPYKT
jgi:hypothetical protein